MEELKDAPDIVKKAHKTIRDSNFLTFFLFITFAIAFICSFILFWSQFKSEPIVLFVLLNSTVLLAVLLWVIEIVSAAVVLWLLKSCGVIYGEIYYKKIFETSTASPEDTSIYNSYALMEKFKGNIDAGEKLLIRNDLWELKRAIDFIEKAYSNISFEEKTTKNLQNISKDIAKIILIVNKPNISTNEMGAIRGYFVKLFNALQHGKIKDEEFTLTVSVDAPKKFMDTIRDRWGNLPGVFKYVALVIFGLAMSVFFAHVLSIFGFSRDNGLLAGAAIVGSTLFLLRGKF